MFVVLKIDRPIPELGMNRPIDKILHSLFSAAFSQHYLINFIQVVNCYYSSASVVV